MKKYTLYCLVILLAAGGLYVAFAANDSNMPMMNRRGMMGKGMMDGMKGGCPMCMMRCGAMMEKKMVATEDGGVIIMACGELMKFDNDLNLVKKVEIPVDEAKMQAKMQKMMETCPMCKMMKQKSAAGEGM